MIPKPIALTEAKYILEQYGYSHVRIEAIDVLDTGGTCTVQLCSTNQPAWIRWWMVRVVAWVVRRINS
jgi:hypothetical protein